MIKIHSSCRDNKILLLSSLNIITALPYPLKYETFSVFPLFCHSTVSKQHFQLNGKYCLQGHKHYLKTGKTLCNLTVTTPKVNCHKSGLKITPLHELHLV